MPELNFKGKEFVYNHHLSVPFRPLVPQIDKSIGEGRLDGNLIIHGDNLHALKALMPMYAGKVDCIFIDPPYNTGSSEWSYNDNVNSPIMQEWLRNNPVNGDDMLRHDKWLCMMMPRLKLMYELMAEGGLIAITIDNNELSRLWLLMDEIFGERNLVACAPWLSEPSGGKEKTGLRTGHEYVLIYSKGRAALSQDETELGDLRLSDEQGEYLKGRELRKWGGVSRREDRPRQWFPVIAPDGTEVYPIRNDGQEGHWRWGKSNTEMVAILADPSKAHWEKRPFDKGISWNGLTERWVPYEKVRSSRRNVGWKTWLENLAFNADGTRVIKEIFGEKVFDTPKPVELIEWVISIVPDDEALVLDSFSGAGTSAHAVLEANKKDKGNRHFILVECEEYADKLTAERVRRIINGYEFNGIQREDLMREKLNFTSLKKADALLTRINDIEINETPRFDRIKKEVKNGELLVIGEKNVEEKAEGFGGSFTFCTLGDPIELDRLLSGETLPSFESLGSVLFHMATSMAFDPGQMLRNDGYGYLGSSSDRHVWLIYKSDLGFLKSPSAALTLERAKAFVKEKPDKPHLVFAPSRFVSRKILEDNMLPLEFAPLPFALYRISNPDIQK